MEKFFFRKKTHFQRVKARDICDNGKRQNLIIRRPQNVEIKKD